MTTLFDEAVAFVLRHDEGGLTDVGVVTNFGISQRAFPDLDVRALTRERAIAIYHEHYWKRLRCDELPGQVAILLFDCGVNQGPGQATLLLQEALGVKIDGVLGPVTLAAARRYQHDDLAAEVCARRALAYAKVTPFRLDRLWARVVSAAHGLLPLRPGARMKGVTPCDDS